jgi:hypothetical protein
MRFKTLERVSAMFGILLFSLLFVVACFAKEMTVRDAVIFAVLGLAFGYGWLQLQNSN